ncbi:hypothetical protein JRA67_003340 [Acinetobacter baumannii]|uniref:hypothetical protein n=2 Tax=Acinetobacter baumannii TaxID=470 RepID=UPI000992AD3B|nr:hypothetical protein [Acinetobacter baumannii]EKT8679928.1 hypothetical protein [Acinetobacter baumannii]EKU0560660.1 hypothetical protein [Acinetobacter baumannii]EKU2508071.1 hypothetical protein [Acinetobacter baumannii]EKW2952409.1 hypothetical protein [Acinetobacter baumannii]EKW7200763.1 hypothetical protein [Acinetobacter baumannii]
MKSFLIYDSLIKRYVLLTVGLIIIAFMIAIFFKGELEIDFAIGAVCGYLNIFLLLKNYRFPLIPEVKEDSDDLVIYTRVSLLIFFVLIEFVFLLAALF